MARPTLAQQIAKAAAAGDMAKVQKLAEQLQASKTASKKDTTKDAAKERDVMNVVNKSTPTEPRKDFSEQFSVIRPTHSNGQNGHSSPQVIVPNSNGTVAKKSTVGDREYYNQFHDDGTSFVADHKVDSKVYGDNFRSSQKREAAEKVRIMCSICNEEREVWPGEIGGGTIWSCDECLSKRAR